MTMWTAPILVLVLLAPAWALAESATSTAAQASQEAAATPRASRVATVQRNRPLKIIPPDPQAYLRELHAAALEQQASEAASRAKTEQPHASQRRVERVDRIVPESSKPTTRSILSDATPREEPAMRAADDEARRAIVRQRRDEAAARKGLTTDR